MNQPVKLTADQIIGAIHEMPPEQCRMLLYTLAERAAVNRERTHGLCRITDSTVYANLVGWIGMP